MSTKNDEVIVVPGKVLGSGEMNHNLTVCAFSISEMARKENSRRRRKVITLNELIDRNPEGRVSAYNWLNNTGLKKILRQVRASVIEN